MFVTDAPYSAAGLDAYRPLVGDENVERIRALAEPLRGARVLHVNATRVGGGVAELLLSLVPLMRAVGLDTRWYVLDARPPFFEVTKAYHNALQGEERSWSPEAFEVYWRGCRMNAHALRERTEGYDFVVVHDPQPMVLRTLMRDSARWIWRCHIDLTAPSPDVWRMLAPHLAGYDLLVFSAPEYIPDGLEAENVSVALPCIDPFRPKNEPLEADDVRGVLEGYGVDPVRPYLLQVSRFDRWKDPIGVVEAYRRVKRQWSALQLVYMAAMAADDPEGRQVYAETGRAAGDDPDAHLLALDVSPADVARNAREVNAMQRGARVVLQKSLREGFGLTVAEALWKRKPVVAGDAGGIRYQICDGWNGYLVDSVDECAARVQRLLEDRQRAHAFGRRGRAVVETRFLFTRLLEQYLLWLRDLAGSPVPDDIPRSAVLEPLSGAALPALVERADRAAAVSSSGAGDGD